MEVTRSLSNFYSGGNLFPNSATKRIINSNDVFEQKIKERQEKERKSQIALGILPENSDEEFVEGIFAQEVEVQEKEPEIDFEALQKKADAILLEAQKKADAILENAQMQAKDVLDEAATEGKKLGYEDGLLQGKEELKEQKKALEAEKVKLQEDYQKELKELEPQLLDVILRVVDKVFHVQFGEKKDILLYLIQNTLSNIESGRDFVVRTSQDNIMFLQAQVEGIQARVGQGVTIDFVADPTLYGMQCVIECANGVFECGSDVQLENLIADLRSLCC